LRRLIINADDFGLTPGVNRAILEAHRFGVVTSATMMANAAAFDDALCVSHDVPALGIGCHVVLVDGTPVLPAEEIPDLVEPGSRHFHGSLSKFVGLIVRGRIRPEQIEAEARAQISKLQTAGVHVTHVDTHKHTHMFPQVLRPLLRAAKACGIRRIRNPFEPMRLASVKRGLRTGPRILKRWTEVKALRMLRGGFLRSVKKADMLTPEGTLGIVATGILDQKMFNDIVAEIPQGSWEFVCHPGYNDADLQLTATRLGESRLQELRVLTSAETRDHLQELGIQLISYVDFG
jgi:chitin disaccharide deacetylase